MRRLLDVRVWFCCAVLNFDFLCYWSGCYIFVNVIPILVARILIVQTHLQRFLGNIVKQFVRKLTVFEVKTISFLFGS